MVCMKFVLTSRWLGQEAIYHHYTEHATMSLTIIITEDPGIYLVSSRSHYLLTLKSFGGYLLVAAFTSICKL